MLMQDLRFACRQLRKNPGFACIAVLMLALGICSCVAIFAFVDATLIKPLPYREPGRLAALYESTPFGPRYHLSYLDYLDWKRLNKVFSSLEAYDDRSMALSTATGARQVDGVTVSDGFFRALGIAPVLGRDFHPGEDLPSAARTVILSYSAWQRRFGGRADALGKTVVLDSAPNVVIGVLPRGFHFAPVEPTEFWITLHRSTGEDRGGHGLAAIGRLKDGVSVQTADADMGSIAAQLAKEYPDADGGRGATVISLTEAIVGDFRPILLALLGGSALLLLIASINVSSLLLVRSEGRRREVAVRGALGASPRRLRRQFITEGLVLAAMGSALGVGGASFVMQLLTRLIPANVIDSMSYLTDLGLNTRVAVFAFALSLVSGLLFSVIPMLRLSANDFRAGLSEGGRGAAGTVWRRFGANLVVLELATAMVLLVSAGLLGKSFYRLLHTEIGMEPEHLATVRLRAPLQGYEKDERIVALKSQVVARLASLPGVESIGISHSVPVRGGGDTTIEILGKPASRETNVVNNRQVSPEYFRTIQARLLQGRYFQADEDVTKPRVAIINHAMASRFFPGEDPVGKMIRYEATDPIIEIVGVVEDIKEGPLDEETRPAMYVPFDQEPDRSFYVFVRTSQSEQSVLPSLSMAIHGIDPGILVFDERTMTDRVQNSQTAYLHRSAAWLVGGFAAMALVLGVVGLYGVIAYSVSQRTREIGVRMALGAQRASVYQLILKEAGWLTLFGIAVGVACSIGAAISIRSLLFGVSAWDVSTLAMVAGGLGVCAMLASYFPARRAASVNPVEALRAE